MRSVADSFTSLMNYGADDYILGHILNAARQSGKSTLEIDLLSRHATPDELLTPPVRRSVQGYCDRFPQLLRSNGSDPTFVRAARLKLEFDISISRSHRATSFTESPYVCTTTIEDDRGKIYETVLDGWWYPEQLPESPSRPGLRLRNFFRRDP